MSRICQPSPSSFSSSASTPGVCVKSLGLFENLSSILKFPAAYRLFRRIVGGERATRIYLDEYARPAGGEKILDIGCGPADVLDYLPGMNYTGLDISPEYIAAAKTRFGSRGRFCCGDVGQTTIEREQGTFDLVLAIGVLHHLNDDDALKLFALARLALHPGGRLVTYDGCYTPEQSIIARRILCSDRGKFVRAEPEYRRLACVSFDKAETHLRHDLLRMPYTHCIMCCTN